MNEWLFLTHLFIAVTISWGALKLGKEGLFAWVILQPILANLFVLKQIVLFGYHVTCSDVYAVGCILSTNLLQEYYGKEAAKKGVWLSFLAMVLFVAMAMIHLHYVPSHFDATQGAYESILWQAPRLVIASIASFLIVQQLDMRFFAFLKEKLPATTLRVRNAISLTTSQAVDTLLFTFFGLYGLVSCLFDVFIVSFIIKCSIALVLSFSTPRRLKTHDLFV